MDVHNARSFAKRGKAERSGIARLNMGKTAQVFKSAGFGKAEVDFTL
jgi:hypothetical protein